MLCKKFVLLSLLCFAPNIINAYYTSGYTSGYTPYNLSYRHIAMIENIVASCAHADYPGAATIQQIRQLAWYDSEWKYMLDHAEYIPAIIDCLIDVIADYTDVNGEAMPIQYKPVLAVLLNTPGSLQWAAHEIKRRPEQLMHIYEALAETIIDDARSAYYFAAFKQFFVRLRS